MSVLVLALQLLVAYALGSISGSLLLGRARGVDIRKLGSGNAGGTNAFRTQGALFALGVVAIDIGKGAAAAWLGSRPWFGAAPALADPAQSLVCGAAAAVGHVWPVWHGFRGGKGAGTLVGVLAVVFPLALAPLLLVWFFVLTGTGYVGLATICAGLALPIAAELLADPAAHDALVGFGIFAALFLVFTHRENVARLAAGREHRFERARLFRRRAR